MLDEFLNEKVVVDLKSPFVCLGTLVRFDDHYLELKGADFHDLRDTDTSRENYVAAAQYARGEALDVFCYQGGFALHLARVCQH